MIALAQDHRTLQQSPGRLRGLQDQAAQERGREEAESDDSGQEVPGHSGPGDRGPRHLHQGVKVTWRRWLHSNP